MREKRTQPRTDDTDAGSGGAGAPPEPRGTKHAPPGLTREYESSQIRVQWFAQRCIHSAACIRALPEVFDPGRRPWVAVDAALIRRDARLALCRCGQSLHMPFCDNSHRAARFQDTPVAPGGRDG